MCDLCNNSVPRTYTHSLTKPHLKRLFKLMKERQENGYYSLNTKKKV